MHTNVRRFPNNGISKLLDEQPVHHSLDESRGMNNTDERKWVTGVISFMWHPLWYSHSHGSGKSVTGGRESRSFWNSDLEILPLETGKEHSQIPEQPRGDQGK